MHLTSLVVIATGLAELGLVSGFRLPLPRLSRSIRRDDSPQVILDIPGIPKVPTSVSRVESLPLNDIQADILVGMTKPSELFYFFTIQDPVAFKNALQTTIIPMITSVSNVISRNSDDLQAIVNIAFSATGLQTLNVTDSLGDSFFQKGQFSDAAGLGDVNPTQNWIQAFQGTSIHGVLLIASSDNDTITATLANATAAIGSSASVAYTLNGAVRPGSETGHEHFGFLDGISQPAIQGYLPALPGQSLLPPGEILTGETGDSTTRPAWAKDGSFLVFRQLKQLVPEFNKFTVDHPTEGSSELTGARMIGRWKSGAPIDLAPTQDDLSIAADIQRNQNFTYDHPEIQGFNLSSDQTRCPFSAHMRKTRPRADIGNPTTHQILRAGIPYGPEVTTDEAASNTTSIDRGLAFVCYQSDISQGFHFLQATWANNANFPPRKSETPGLDPIIGANGNAQSHPLNGLNPANASEVATIQPFVESRGGEYFFSPSISALSNTIAA